MRRAESPIKQDSLADYFADFFFLRSPLLPVGDLSLLGQGEEAVLRLAKGLEISEALFVASPALTEGLERDADQNLKKGERRRQALTRYLLRLMTRSTPFGLFAGGSLGKIGDHSALELAGRREYRRHTRLDMDYLDRLARDLERDHEVRARLTYRPNSSLYRAADRLRYAEGRLNGTARTYHLVAARADAFLETALTVAAAGARLDEVARAIVAVDQEAKIEFEEAVDFVHELIDAQILVSDLGLKVTGDEPIHDLIRRLEAIDKTLPVAACLAEVKESLAELDSRPLGASVEIYRELAAKLTLLGTTVELPRLFQVDMTKKAEKLMLGPAVIDEVKRTIDFLYRLRGGSALDSLTTFRDDFLRRYEPGRFVRLFEVLDEEVGLGFQKSTEIGMENSPLLLGLAFPGRPATDPQVRWNAMQDLILRKTVAALSRGAKEVVWSDEDLEPGTGRDRMPASPMKPLYGGFQASFSIVAASAAAIDAGAFQLVFKGASGASGATLLGRFCHADDELTELVKNHLRCEEALTPDAVFAEIVHLPEGRIGNILLRPLLREYEIPFLGHSGADPEKQIAVDELLVTVVGDSVVLYSERLGKRVIPRLSSAHNYSLRGLGVYRFLSALQHHGTCSGLSWSWGTLEALPFLPRVVYGRSIVASARWLVDKTEIDAWSELSSGARATALASWREQRGIPCQVLLADGDNELFIDFGNTLIVDAFVAIIKNRRQIVLTESHLDEDALPVVGPEGCFLHEIILPFVKKPTVAITKAAAGSGLLRPEIQVHAPGSSWVYAKLYTGNATADGLLESVAQELVQRFGKEISTFFFVRFSDPDFHLRLRFEVPDTQLRAELLRHLQDLVQEELRSERVWDFRLETYRPEVERYGGTEGLRQCHRLFHADSMAALNLLPLLSGDEGAETRWLIAAASVDRLVVDLLGSDSEARRTCLASMARSFGQEFRFDRVALTSINARLREKRTLIDEALGRVDLGSVLGQARAFLAARSHEWREPVAELRRLEAEGILSMPMSTLTSSLAHMAINRLIPAEGRAHEAVIYELLHRDLLSQQKRRTRAVQLEEV